MKLQIVIILCVIVGFAVFLWTGMRYMRNSNTYNSFDAPFGTIVIIACLIAGGICLFKYLTNE